MKAPRARRSRALLLLWGGLLLWPLVLPLDGLWVAARFPGSQWLATAVIWACFALAYRSAHRRLRHALTSAVFIATAGEVFFSLGLGMYEYRLGNIPFYVPPGHAILYATVFSLSRDAWARRHRTHLSLFLYAAAALYSGLWLLLLNDVYGWICFGVFSVVVALNPESRVFLLGMYLLVGYLELIGTSLGCWHWPGVLLGRFEGIPSGNPPSGIASFYFGLDVGCLWAYLWTYPALRRRYLLSRVERRPRAGLRSPIAG